MKKLNNEEMKELETHLSKFEKDDEGYYLCVMCGERAEFLGKPTSEPLCEKCNNTNEEILKHKISKVTFKE